MVCHCNSAKKTQKKWVVLPLSGQRRHEDLTHINVSSCPFHNQCFYFYVVLIH